ncbi:putative Fimbrial protein pilin [Candidatus Competibacter denitrificans Run_A_D11]|uniref:Fimbrial protein pilin n=2 Tax=Candidatus Competibacter TaxID=221279 RepID=W6ME25_9GAMM|nr:putative Fimbrial protein pilin [Candidatus Competibacter denitrificans Run_A_D11]HRC69398.1 type IV pilin protein [Candidatus Competibacter denitrificans]
MTVMNNHDDQGFTLIELMIVVVVIAILAAIAYPSYMEQVARGKRTDAKTVMLEAGQVLERRYTECGGYKKKSDCSAAANMGEVLPASSQASPKEGATKWYQLDASGKTTVTDTTFTLVFNPQGSLSSDKCGSFSLSNTGQKQLIISGSVSSNATLVGDCWNR